MIRIMINNFNSKTSRFYYKFKKYYQHKTPNVNFKDTKDTTPSIHTIEAKKEVERQLQFIDNQLNTIHWFDAQVFKIYYFDNHSLNTMAKATRISRNTLYKSINIAKKHLKENLNKYDDGKK